LSNRRSVFFCVLFLCLIAALPAWGRREKNGTGKTEAPETAIVNITGVVRLVGSGFMPELVITGPEMEWYVSGEEEHLLKDLQHRTVTIEGYETVVDLKLANGFFIGQRHTLKDIKIISVE